MATLTLAIVFLSALVLIGYIQKTYNSLSWAVFFALIFSLVLGQVCKIIFPTTNINDILPWANLVANTYLKLLMMMALPFVFISILSSFVKLNHIKTLGQIGGLSIFFLLLTCLIGAIIGVISAELFSLDPSALLKNSDVIQRGQTLTDTASKISQDTLPDIILKLIPENLFFDLTGQQSTSVIHVVI